MKFLRQSLGLSAHFLSLELRNKNAFFGLLIYAVSTVFVTYLSTQGFVSENIYAALIWILLLFISINAAGKSFLQTNDGLHLFYFQSVPPNVYLLGKHLFTAGLVLILILGVSGLCMALFSPHIESYLGYFGALILGATGFAFTIGFLSAVAQTAAGNFTMVSILSFPVLLPFFLTQVKLMNLSLVSQNINLELKYIGILFLLNLLVLGLSLVLFPYLWRD